MNYDEENDNFPGNSEETGTWLLLFGLGTVTTLLILAVL